MDKNEFLSKIQEIGTCEDEATRRTLLTEVNTGISKLFDDADTLTKANQTLTENNKVLLDANTKLFLQVGEDRPPEGNPNQGGNDKPPKKYEDLFNEKGELK